MDYSYKCNSSFQTAYLCTSTTAALDAGAAVDNLDGTVTIPVTSHPFTAGDVVLLAGTVNYDGVYEVEPATSTDTLVITATYVAETFTADMTAALMASVASTIVFVKGNRYTFSDPQAFLQLDLITDDSDLTSDLAAPFRVTLNGNILLPQGRRIYQTLSIPATAICMTGAVTDPDRTEATGLIEFLKTGSELITGVFALPRTFPAGGRIHPKLTVIPADNGGGTARFTLGYKLVAVGAAIPGSYTEVSATATFPEAIKAGTVDFGPIDLTGAEEGNLLLFTLTRVANGTTYTYDDTASLAEISIAVEADSFGSGLSDQK